MDSERIDACLFDFYLGCFTGLHIGLLLRFIDGVLASWLLQTCRISFQAYIGIDRYGSSDARVCLGITEHYDPL